jgi:hypothetical protein
MIDPTPQLVSVDGHRLARLPRGTHLELRQLGLPPVTGRLTHVEVYSADDFVLSIRPDDPTNRRMYGSAATTVWIPAKPRPAHMYRLMKILNWILIIAGSMAAGLILGHIATTLVTALFGGSR